jgi:DNA-binding NtrC family response regulator
MASPAQVLVVDDEAIVCERLKGHLEENNFQVETFTDSQEAINRLAERAFEVVVTDLKMEGPTGLDVLRFVRDHSRGTQVIIITGYASLEAAKQAEYTGVYDFITKPFELKSMTAMVKKAAKKARKLKGRQDETPQEGHSPG